MKVVRNGMVIGLGALLLGTVGCSKEPSGQVVAVVNGEEVTIDELNAELGGANLPSNIDKSVARRQLLQQIVERKLLVQMAKADGIDADPAYIRQQRRMNDELIVRMYASKAANTVPIPDAKAVDEYIAQNPQMFAQRTRYALDQISFPLVTDQKVLKEIESNKTMTDLKATLDRNGIKYQPAKGNLDSGVVPPATLKQILALPRTEPFVTPAGGQLIASIITGSTAVTVPSEQTKPIATQSIRSEKLKAIGEQRMKEARAKAEIKYQPGYEAVQAPKPAAK